MGSMSKVLMYELSRDTADHSHDDWCKKAVWTFRL